MYGQNQIKTQQLPDIKIDVNELGGVNMYDYKSKCIKKFREKTGFTEESEEKLKRIYYKCVVKFDHVCDVACIYIIQFREVTKDIIGFRSLYYVYDKLYLICNAIEMFRVMQSWSSTPSLLGSRNLAPIQARENNTSTSSNSNFPETESKTETESESKINPITNLSSIMNGFGDLGNLGNLGSLGDIGDIGNFGDFGKIQEQMKNLSPQQHKVIDDMASEMFGKMFGNSDVSSLINNNKPQKTKKQQKKQKKKQSHK
jgi:hypothetical protein